MGGNVIRSNNVNCDGIFGDIVLNIDAVEGIEAANSIAKLNNSRLWLHSEIVGPVNCRIKINVTCSFDAHQDIPCQRNRTIEVNIIVFGSDIPIINTDVVVGAKSQCATITVASSTSIDNACGYTTSRASQSNIPAITISRRSDQSTFASINVPAAASDANATAVCIETSYKERDIRCSNIAGSFDSDTTATIATERVENSSSGINNFSTLDNNISAV